MIARQPDRVPRWALRWGPLALASAVSLLIGIVGTTIATVEWGDRRYIRRDEFAAHAKAQDQLEVSREEGNKVFVTRTELAEMISQFHAHIASTSHPGTAADLTTIRILLAQVQADVAWLKEQERRRAR